MGNNLREVLSSVKVVPVIKLEEVKEALPLTDALLAGGLNVAEITFRTPAAAASIEAIRTNRPDVVVGAGTILSVGQAKEALKSGASFLVSPGFNREVVEYSLSQGVHIIPGVITPSEVEMGISYGLDILKLFPAEAVGGIKLLNSYANVYKVDFMPTGGISPANLKSYLNLKNVVACGGSWMVTGELITSGKFEEITKLTKEALALAEE